MNNKLCLLALTVVSVLLSVSLPALAERRSTLYLGPTFSRLSIGGDFEGNQVLIQQNTGNAYVVPSFDSGIGFGVVGGVRSTLPSFDLALEFHYQQSRLRNYLVGIENDKKATFHEVGLTLKSYFRPAYSLQPFLGLGMDFPWLTVPDGEVTPALTTSDATFRGIGFHVGGGVCYFIIPSVSVEAFMAYSHRHFSTLNGIKLEGFSKDSGSFEPTLTLRYHFGFGNTSFAPRKQNNPSKNSEDAGGAI